MDEKTRLEEMRSSAGDMRVLNIPRFGNTLCVSHSEMTDGVDHIVLSKTRVRAHRWEMMLGGDGSIMPFKLNNNYRAFYLDRNMRKDREQNYLSGLISHPRTALR